MRKNIHFFKAASRLGLINKPNKSDEVNSGVEQGPDAVLSLEFLRQLESDYSLSHYMFPEPESVQKSDYFSVLAQYSAGFAAQINSHIRPGQIQAVIGGDHSVAFPSILAVLQRLAPQTTVGYIQFDSHGDLHRVATSPSGNFHGMWLRALTETVGEPAIDALVHRRIDPHAAIIYGNLDLEAEENRYIKTEHIDVWDEDELIKDFDFAKSFMRSYITRYDHIHVSFDIDVFDREFAPATGTPAPDGLDPSHVFPLLEILSRSRSLSMDLVEVNPTKPGADTTIEIGQKVIEVLLGI